MLHNKSIGIFMDHTNANIIHYPLQSNVIENVNSTFSNVEKTMTLGKSEQLMHNKENHEQAAYYKKLGEMIKEYDQVLLFGPTLASTELKNTLKANHQFTNIEIVVKHSDKLTQAQQESFVKDFFETQSKDEKKSV